MRRRVRQVTYPPEFLARYQPEEILGEGGMGFVVRATDRELGRTVAAKFQQVALAGDKVAAERFLREARVSAKLDHPSVVRVYDFGVSGDRAYAIYEYIEGTDLRRWLDANGAMAPARAIELVCEVLDALEAAHAAGVIHRDIKPANVLLDSTGAAKVADFGIARLDVGRGLTQSGALLGTPGYLAPEQLEGHKADARADVYSAAALLYELLAGRPPFLAERTADTLARQTKGPPEPVDRLAGGLPQELPELLSQALDPLPSKRPRSAADFASQLRGLAPFAAAVASPVLGAARAESALTAASGIAQVVQAQGRTGYSARRPSRGAAGAEPGLSSPTVSARGSVLSLRPASSGSSRRLLLLAAGVGAAIVLGLVLFLRPTQPLAPVPTGDTVVTRPAVPELSVPSRTVVGVDFRILASENAIRVRFQTSGPASVRALLTGPGSRPVLASSVGPPTSIHDLWVGGASPATTYQLRVESADPAVALTAEVPLESVKTSAPGTAARIAARFRQLSEGLWSSMSLLDSRISPFEDLLLGADMSLASKVLEILPRRPADERVGALRLVAATATPRDEPALLDLFLARGGSADEQEAVAQALAWVAGPETVKRVTAALEAPVNGLPADLRLGTVLGGAARRSAEAASLLAAQLSGGSPRRRVAVVAVLARTPHAVAVADLVRAFHREPEPSIREILLEGISLHPAELEKLLPLALGDRPPGIGPAALPYCAIRPVPSLVPRLEYLYANAPAPIYRIQALRVLGKIGSPAAVKALVAAFDSTKFDLETMKDLRGLLEISEVSLPLRGYVQQRLSAAAIALADAGAVDALGRLAGMMPREAGGINPVWLAAGWLAGLPGAPEPQRARVAELCRSELERKSSRMALAAWVLGRSGTAADVARLVALASEGPVPVRIRALDALGFLDPRRCKELLDRLAGESQDFPRTWFGREAAEVAAAGQPGLERVFHVPWGLRFHLVGKPLVAGQPLTLHVSGLTLTTASPFDDGPFAVREGAVSVKATRDRRLALGDGPLVFCYGSVPPPPGPDGKWFFSVCRN